MPILYSCNGKNIPPGLYWQNPPPNTKSYILFFYSPDTPQGIFYNWVVFNIPGATTALPEGENLPEDSIEATNSAGDNIYRGPCPPDSYVHHYIFDLYALDTVLNISENATASDVLNAAHHHILKQTTLDSIFTH
jgi:Raf kinase inhibitor-like YbhB/YbcL family protein